MAEIVVYPSPSVVASHVSCTKEDADNPDNQKRTSEPIRPRDEVSFNRIRDERYDRYNQNERTN